MSRLNDLLRQLRMENESLADDLQREFDALADRRSFGLNFERHVPEAVELPGRKVRKGDKVRVLPPRGERRTKENDRLWQVTGFITDDDGRRASLVALDDDTTEVSVIVDDLVVVAEFRDPIYPGLVSTGKVERGGDKPFHTVINAENYHALQTLLFTHRGKVDCIYIDPPYNTGAKDWKYNNDYVEGDDLYRHSKWLAFMERRLLLAKQLLNPSRSALIVAIGDEEVHRLRLLMEQTMPDATVQVVTSVVNPRGRFTAGRFLRTAEYLLCMCFGSMDVKGGDDPDFSEGELVPWRTLRRSDIESRRGSMKGGTSQFYPIYVDVERSSIESLGVPIGPEVDRNSIRPPHGCVAVFPVRDDGTEMNWGLTRESLALLIDQGFVRVGRATPAKPQKYEISYMTSGRAEDIRSGRARVVEVEASGAVVARYVNAKQKMPPNVWSIPSHNAEVGGTNLLKSIFVKKRFDYPKSVYAVEDTLRHFLHGEDGAVVLDFFAGSGTTAHAVMRLNRQDGGQRQCISVTNNEVSADEQQALTEAGLRPGDPEWEALGICDHVTKPRIGAAVTGRSVAGKPITGEYKFMDEFPMAEGFEENVEFLTLTYGAPLRVASNREFAKIAPLLWMRAGSQGRRIDDLSDGWDVADVYGVIADLDKAQEFLKALAERETVSMAFIVTDEDRLFEALVAELPDHVEPVRLYEAYLRNFEIEAGRAAR